MQRRSVIHDSVSVDVGGAASMSTTNERSARQRRLLKRRKKVAFRSHYGTEIGTFLFLALACFVLLGCFILVGFKIYDALTGTTHTSHRHRWEADDYTDELPFNPIYQVKEAIESVGDRTDRYAKLRMQIDPLLPDDPERSARRVQELTTHTYQTHPMDPHNSDQMTYDIYDCPDTPPTGYPFAWNIMRILQNWPTDDPQPRSHIYQGLCVFDYTKDYDKAMTYRNAEVPFVVINDPAVHKTVERWNVPGYMQSLLGRVEHRCEYSANNHFMYYTPVGHHDRHYKRHHDKIPEGWTEPTEQLRLTFREWLNHANVTDDYLGPDMPHWYFRLIGCGSMGNDGSCDRGSSEYLYDELPYFQPKPNLYIREPKEQKGIHCRFGMKGVIAENHFDGSRNAIIVLGGSRRYILSHPNECENLALFPKGHPSARHSAVDWSDPDLQEYPEFEQAAANEVVMQPGQVLYL